MRITFHGAAREVTGSMHLIEVNGRRLLLETGLFQGRRAETYERNLHFPFDAQSIDAVLLSHAHIDHSGNLPNLAKQGFSGNIWCTSATRNLCTYMLMDSGHIQEQDALYVNKKRQRDGESLIEPLYTQSDVRACLELFVGVGFNRPITVVDGVEATFFTAGHILGAASVQLDIKEFDTGKQWRVLFSGDIGRPSSPILKAPTTFDTADIVIMECTYGNRLHGDYDDARKRLRNVVNSTIRRRGKVIIPAFAVGRTQELVYALNQLDAGGDIPSIPVFVDSPLAVNATDVFRMHPEAWNDAVQHFLTEDNRRSPFDYEELDYIRDVRESKRLNNMAASAIIISANGMAEAGRILHHLKNNIENPDNTVLLVSFMAENTLGRRIQDGEKSVRIFGESYQVRATVEVIDGYSAHADQEELLDWVKDFDPKAINHLFLVHGEPVAADTFQQLLQARGFGAVTAPERGQSYEF
ncbi:MAG: MBL fold metallo-hydrolase [Anaerolineales bacterium]|nr:MBL fold metallo-hydrolase [Anaerolineales bacterium]